MITNRLTCVITFYLNWIIIPTYSRELDANNNRKAELGNSKNYHSGLMKDFGSGSNYSYHSVTQLNRLTNRTCFSEIPAVLLFTRHFEEPNGNGSSKYFVKLKVCCEGYKPHKFDKKKCAPDCGSKCWNGFCIKPGNCECFPGFVMNLDGECVQTCPHSCLNGQCHSNGTCICEPGFQLDRSKQMCSPNCTGGCKVNQNCTAPEHCTCVDGFKMNLFGDCEHYCRKNCVFGDCIGPNMCKCNPGYNLKDGVCQTNCTQLCTHGTCVRANRCICDSGYKYDYQTTACLPQCRYCVNGVCMAPGCCKCFKDFKKVKGICTHKRNIKED